MLEQRFFSLKYSVLSSLFPTLQGRNDRIARYSFSSLIALFWVHLYGKVKGCIDFWIRIYLLYYLATSLLLGAQS